MFLREELHVGEPDGGGTAAAVGEKERCFLWDRFRRWWWEGDEKFEGAGWGGDVCSCYSGG